MLIIVTWDDSDGWYDHVMPQIVSQSNDPEHDALLGRTGLCGHAPPGIYQDRCGYGPRLPFLAISPYAKVNFIFFCQSKPCMQQNTCGVLRGRSGG
jgi:phospholipase C